MTAAEIGAYYHAAWDTDGDGRIELEEGWAD